MKIAIHHRSGSFSDRWIIYCQENDIQYKIINCYDNDIINQVRDCDAILWHFHHEIYKDVLFAKQLLLSIELSGKRVFPDMRTSWHFDDKVGQKYLLESFSIPLVPSYVFYTKKDAFDWVNTTSFPKVFKLRGGAGSANVKMIKNKDEAISIIHKAFGAGFSQFDRLGYFKEKYNKFKDGKETLLGVVKSIGRIFLSTEFAGMIGREKGYVYFQDFIPDNDFDIRVIVVDRKAFAIKRMVRKEDFRASGSGSIVYEKENFDLETIGLALNTAKILETQCCAFDFVYDISGNPLIVEISYGFAISGYEKCVGYWDDSMKFHEGHFNPYGWMIDTLLKE